ncbi:MAG: SDR family oxidoreductase [Flavobacteriales bacterium]|nr:SDR family oxidoreductase [Flavobacteriales bacterium]
MKAKTVLITGASRGIGRATAIAFSNEGYRVGINYRSNRTSAESCLAELQGSGHQIFRADISSRKGIEQLFNDVIEAFGRIDVLVNSAGIAIENSMEQTPDEWLAAWDKTMDTNINGLAYCCFRAAKHMMEQKSGRIINISSRGAFRGEPDMLAYGASKGAVNSLTQSLAKALGKYNIGVTAVAPGFVNTDMAEGILKSPEGEMLINESPFNRVAEPEEVAKTVLFLADESSLFLSGTIVDVNGASYFRM